MPLLNILSLRKEISLSQPEILAGVAHEYKLEFLCG